MDKNKMSMLETLIKTFSTDKLQAFLNASITSFKPDNDDDNLDQLIPENIKDKYESVIKIGEADIDNDVLIVIASKTNEPLSERTGKKNQYHIAKTILKVESKDAAIFVFYDEGGNFRFSFVKANYLGTKREFTDFKRYTYFVETNKTNKTFIDQVGGCNFQSLDEITQAFSVGPLNKDFYNDIVKAFYNLIDNENKKLDTSLKLPFTPVETNRKIYQEFAVRLIGRIIFCWFLKAKKSDAGKSLIPDSWLSSKDVKEDYYHSILEKLFFLVLNTNIKNRKANFLLPDNHSDIPFLNGGLFEPHTQDYFVNNKANHALKIPNKWFKELYETLEQYNFTIDENSIYDSEVSIDPEMLGTIFENLLAEIDPDTSESARKSTGSFYTPREIVDYMVEQSLVQYLKTKLINSQNSQNSQNSSPFRGGAEGGGVLNTNTEGGGVKNINNLPHLKTFRKELRNNLTPAEATLWKLLKGKQFEGHKFRRQFSVANYILDFYCHEEKLAIELDGQGHFEVSQAEYDQERDLFLEHYGIKVLRFENKWVWDNPDVLLEKVKSNFGRANTPQSLRTAPLKREQSVDEQDKHLEQLFREGGENNFDETDTNKILEALSEVKILDPACGSGAFPMGALHKITIALQKLDPNASWWKELQLKNIPNELSKQILKEKLDSENADYIRKLGVIQHSIYGVDIQPIATEITKLRCFLSLVIDENINDKARNRGIQPLPNLEFKFVTANTLIGLEQTQQAKASFDFANTDQLLDKLKDIRNSYLQANGEDKAGLKAEFDDLQTEIYKLEIKSGGISVRAIQLSAWKPFSSESNAWFDPYWMFGVEKFDIVIGNPPYIQLQKALPNNDKQKYGDLYKTLSFDTFERTGDIYALFYEKGIQILKEKGALIYITSNKWMRSGYGESLRKYFSQYNPLLLIDLGPGVFKSATVDSNILHIQNQSNQHNTKALTLDKNAKLNSQNNNDFLKLKNLNEDSWIILTQQEQEIKDRIEKIGIPLNDWDVSINRGVLTGLNEAFIIDGKKKDELIAADPKSAEIIKPLLRGRDIKRYKAEFADKWLIGTFPALKLNIEEFPAIKQHLECFLPKIKQTGEIIGKDENGNQIKTRKETSNKWFETQDQIAYYQDFEKEKIVWNRIETQKKFSLVNKGIMVQDSMHFITGENVEYLISILNSKIINFNLNIIIGTSVGGNAGNLDNIKNLPIPQISSESQKPFETLVDYILLLKQQANKETQSQYFECVIDVMVYELYFEQELKSVGKDVLKHLNDLKPITPLRPAGTSPYQGQEHIAEEEKLAIIQKEYERLHNPAHPVRIAIDTIDQVEIIKIINNTK